MINCFNRASAFVDICTIKENPSKYDHAISDQSAEFNKQGSSLNASDDSEEAMQLPIGKPLN